MTKTAKMAKLSDKQRDFCRHYAKTNSGQDSAIKAGYSKKTARHQACRLLTKDNIRAGVKEERAKLEKKFDFDAEWIRQQYRYLYDEACKDPERQGNPQLAKNCLDSMSKVEAMFTEKRELTGGSINISIGSGIDREG